MRGLKIKVGCTALGIMGGRTLSFYKKEVLVCTSNGPEIPEILA